MIDEQRFLAQVRTATPDEFARLLAHPTADEARVLAAYLGEERYRRMRRLALRRSARARAAPRGNVVVLHGIMGGELETVRGAERDLVWANLWSLARGRVTRLRLDESARREADPQYTVHAAGMLKRSYGELLLTLGARWNVRAFWYDWRKDLDLAADELAARILGWFGPDEPVHLVAHSMGGLVARTFIARHPDRWRKMRDTKSPTMAAGGRLVMLGTPNHGSFAIPQVLTGLEEMVKKVAMLDLVHGPRELRTTFNTFLGSYQMLPSPLVRQDVAWLYQAESYAGIDVSQAHLTAARAHHEKLAATHERMRRDGDAARLLYVAGFNRRTFDGVAAGRVTDPRAYTVTLAGDGRVTHQLGLLADVPTWYVEEGHGDLPANDVVLGALDDLLTTGTTSALATEAPVGVKRSPREQQQQLDAMLAEQEESVQRFAAAAATLQARARSAEQAATARAGAAAVASAGASAGTAPSAVAQAPAAAAVRASPAAYALEEELTRGFLPSPRSARGKARENGGAAAARARGRGARPKVKLELRLVHGSIDAWTGDAELRVDAVAVGHYVGVRPQYAELAIDEALQRALRGRSASAADEDGPLTQFTDRGSLRGELAQPFFVPHPNDSGLTYVIMGMGTPGRFGAPELVVLARELAWAVGRLHKQHLATVLIGCGEGNISVRTAVDAWMRGIGLALVNAGGRGAAHVRRLTIVEKNPQRVAEIDHAIRDLLAQRAADEERDGVTRLEVDYPDRAPALRTLPEPEARPSRPRSAPVTTRLTVSVDGDRYRVGAITSTASLPEREVEVDPDIVREANAFVAGEENLEAQGMRGRVLGKLLMPAALRASLRTDAPIVMSVDASTARVHWEMVSYEESDLTVDAASRDPLAGFLGLGRGFTRQLRTTLAPPPEPPPPAQREMRVLVVADPASDARLPGAEAEGAEVAALFESWNGVYRDAKDHVFVKTLLGPAEATRIAVLTELLENRYDVLHFAGHCFYDARVPARSGWIFSDGQVLAARELQRLDNVPKFVFSNACESGITPDRARDRDDRLAPSFAEAFFARGVTNFVCTAWPVDDLGARTFALRLYGGLLGLKSDEAGEQVSATPPVYMYEAMCAAREALARSETGLSSWGAYQHYGNPFFRFFEVPARAEEPKAAARKGRKRAGRKVGR